MASCVPKRTLERNLSPSKLAISTAGWSLTNILRSSKSFQAVPRISCNKIDLQTQIDGYEKKGVPVIIEGWNDHEGWPKDLFNVASFSKDVKVITARNVHDRSDSTLEISDFIAKCRSSSPNTSPEERERLYGKDADCPQQWNEWLHRAGVIPSSLLPDASTNLLRNLPHSLSVETLMCYLGIGDTFTPCHKDLCASSGQNLMCYTEEGGSSFWFMTQGSDAPKVSAYFHKLNQEIDHENHVVTIEQLAAAPFRVYIAEQKLGDLVLVPPRSCHQVVNHGGITIKTSWSRMTLKGLVTSYYHELPIYRRVCRPEIYQVKATIYNTILRYTNDIVENLHVHHLSQKNRSLPVVLRHNLVVDLKELLRLFDDILIEEYSPDYATISCRSSPQSHAASPSPSNASSVTLTHDGKDSSDVSKAPDGHITCDFCGGDIFQSFFECCYCIDRNRLDNSEMDGRGESCVVCAGCYVEGRSCNCGRMDARQRQPFDNLLQLRANALHALHAFTQDPSFLSVRSQKPYLTPNTGIFRAARVLEQTRKRKRETKACTLRPKDSHIVPFSWALSCKKCHSAKCFSHLLDQRIHSADAILRQNGDESHDDFHNYHLKSKSAYHNATQALLHGQEEGVRLNHPHHRVHAALTYPFCKPVNPNSSLMRIGWYDTEISSSSFDSSSRNQDPCDSGIPTDMPTLPHTAPIPTSTSVWNPKPSSFPRTPSPEDRDPGVSTSLKRKPYVLDFVLVPAARYNIKRKLSNPQSSSNASKATATDVFELTRQSTRDTDLYFPREKHNASKQVRPIPRRRHSMAKSTQSGKISSTQGKGPQKSTVRESNSQATTPNQPQRTERDPLSEENHKLNAIKSLKFKRDPSKKPSGAQKSANHSSSSSARSSSPSVSIPAVDGGQEIARALNNAVTNNTRSSQNTDVVMHEIDQPRTATEHRDLPEGLIDELRGLREQVSHLSTQVAQVRQAPFQIPAPHGIDAVSFVLDQNQPQRMVYCLGLPQVEQYQPQAQFAVEGGWWQQDNHNYSQARGNFYRGPPHDYNGGPMPGGPVRSRFNGHHQSGPHHYRSQPRQTHHQRNDHYRQRNDHHQTTPNRQVQQPHSQSHHWNRGRPHISEAPRYQDSQERFDGCLPGRSISYSRGEWQADRAEDFTRRVQHVYDPLPSGQVRQYSRNVIAPDAREGGSLNRQVIRKSQERELPRLEMLHELSQKNGSTRRSPPPSAQWEDGYEQEDPAAREETTFKASANCSKDAYVDPSFNPWQ